MSQTGFNIANFSAIISQKGVQKNNKFLVRFAIPSLFGSTQNTVRELEFWCDGVNLPGYMIQTFPVLRYGYGTIEKKPNQPSFNDVSLSVIGDGSGDNWKFFKQWMNYILYFDAQNSLSTSRTSLLNADGTINTTNVTTVGTETLTRGSSSNTQNLAELSYKYEYAIDLNILTFNDSGSVIHNVMLRESYPIMLGDLQLNWGDNNNVSRFNLVFTYQDWYST